MTGDPENGKRWFYVQDGRRKGPVAAAHIVEMILGDLLSEDTLVWHSGLDQWVEAHTVEEIQHELPPPVPGTEDDSGDYTDARADAEAMGEETAEGQGPEAAANGQGAESVEGANGGRKSKGGARRRRHHRNRYRLTAGARRSWLVPLIIMVIVVIVVVWYMLRRINEVPPGQIVPTSALAAAALPAA